MRDDCVYLKDILDQIEIIQSGSEITSYEEFENTPLYRNGMVLSIVIIGEAAKRLSEDFVVQHPELPVSLLAKTRDKLVHGYQGTDYKQVWKIIREDIPELKQVVSGILEKLDVEKIRV